VAVNLSTTGDTRTQAPLQSLRTRVPWLDGVSVDYVASSIGYGDLYHGLGRTPRGFFVIDWVLDDLNGPPVYVNGKQRDSLVLELYWRQTGTYTLWVY